ncbi:MAG: AhpC/TSA family protein [Prevotella sp.]|nr:AhpC/TSA family protein [Prevotella sp.]MBR1464435.1 AhpC/TSA family protein [Prevotella sp.]
MKKRFLLATACICSLSALADNRGMLKGRIGNYPDDVKVLVMYQQDKKTEVDTMTLDAGKTFTYETDLPTPSLRYVVLQYKKENKPHSSMTACYMTAGETLEVDFENPETEPSFSGKTAAESRYYNYRPSQNRQYTDDDGNLLPFSAIKQQMAIIQNQYRLHLEGTSKEFSEERNKEIDEMPWMAYMAYEEKARQMGVDNSKNPEFMAFIHSIDLNKDQPAADYVRNGLTPNATLKDAKVMFLLRHFPELYPEESDEVRYMRLVGDSISNVSVREFLSDYCMEGVLALGGHPDMDKIYRIYRPLSSSKRAEHNEKVYHTLKSLQPGGTVSDFELYDATGNAIRFHQIVCMGKVTYIDFWATWCTPCKMEIPYIRTLVDKYADNPNIQFVSISMDRNIEAWKQMIEKDNPSWEQYVLPDNFNSSFAKEYNIVAIPRFMVFDGEGRIININEERPSAENIEEILNGYIQ